MITLAPTVSYYVILEGVDRDCQTDKSIEFQVEKKTKAKAYILSKS